MRPGQLDGTNGPYLLGALLILLLGLAPLTPVAGWASSLPSPPADTLDRLRPEDLFRLHRIGAVRFSPDGDRLAFERVRPGNEGKVKATPSVPFGEPRSDIWIASVDSGETHRLTDGGSDGTGWFHPRWSPDGKRLALLSIQENDVRAWLWEASSDRLRQLTDRQVHMENSGPLLVQWQSSSELVLAVQEAGTPGQGRLLARVSRPGFLAAQSRQRAWSGRESTAYVTKSGLGGEEGPYHNIAEIQLIDVSGPASETLAKGRWPYVRLSPDGRHLATFSLDSVPRDRPFVQERYLYGNSSGVVHLHDSERAASVSEETTAETPEGTGKTARLFYPEHRSLKWAPDGSAYALLTWTAPIPEEDDTRGPRTIAVYDVSTGALTRVGSSRRSIEDFAWTGESSLLVRARSRNTGQRETALDWWRVTRDGNWENLTRGMDEVPDRLVPASGSTAVGVADGELWQISTDGEPRSLTEDFRPDIFRVFRPESDGAVGREPRPLSGSFTALASDDGESELWVMRGSGNSASTISRLPTPAGASFPSSVSPAARAAAFYSIDTTGTWLWMTRARSANSGNGQERSETTSFPVEGAVDTLMAADRWLQQIDAGEAHRFQYEHPSGRNLTAWILLPPDHSPGERHPAVVNVYPGWVQDDHVPSATAINNVIPGLGLQILASEGYAVLFPSIPLRSDSMGPRFDIDDGVLPAVRAAVAEGYADSSRVGLIGHSYGGYGVYNLVTQTDRFQAAIASAGATDLRSAYGIFDARSRYGHMLLPLHLQIWRMGYWETGQGRMGAPPWKARKRYLRNSPLSYVDQVETPLMMIHGNQDHVPVQQAEMFFTSLFRQGKPAKLVRYSGEGHIIRRRANVLDMWKRIISWFDRYLER